jgi:hypothetical protein
VIRVALVALGVFVSLLASAKQSKAEPLANAHLSICGGSAIAKSIDVTNLAISIDSGMLIKNALLLQLCERPYRRNLKTVLSWRENADALVYGGVRRQWFRKGECPNEAKDRSCPSGRYLFIGGIRSPYLGLQIFGIILVGFCFAILCVFSGARAFDNPNRKAKFAGFAICAASFVAGLTFYGWAFTGNPFLFWGLC